MASPGASSRAARRGAFAVLPLAPSLDLRIAFKTYASRGAAMLSLVLSRTKFLPQRAPAATPTPQPPPGLLSFGGKTVGRRTPGNDSQRLANALRALAGIALAADLAERTSLRQDESNRECEKAAL